MRSRFSPRELCGWSLTQIRLHLERLVELEYLATRHARLNNQFVYELLFDVDAPETVAHVGLIDVEKLKHSYNTHLTGFNNRLAGKNGRLTEDGGTPPPA